MSVEPIIMKLPMAEEVEEADQCTNLVREAMKKMVEINTRVREEAMAEAEEEDILDPCMTSHQLSTESRQIGRLTLILS